MAALAVGSPALAQGQSADALDQAERSVVRIVTYAVDDFGNRTPYMTGSGFVVAPGKVVTNRHVAALPPNVTREAIYVIPDAKVGGGAILATQNTPSSNSDLSLLDVPSLTAPVMTIALSAPTKDATVRALGYPGVADQERSLTQDQMLQEPTEPYVTPGAIALISTVIDDGSGQPVDSIFHTAPMNPGNSGGPLIDACGRAIGINTWQGATQVGEGGEINVPQGQSIAQASSVLARFLQAQSVSATTVTTACTPPEEQALQDRLKADEAAIAAEKDQLAKAQTDLAARSKREHTIQLLVILGVVLLGLIGGVFLFFRRRGAPPPTPAPVAVAPPSAPPPAEPPAPTIEPAPAPPAAESPAPVIEPAPEPAPPAAEAPAPAVEPASAPPAPESAAPEGEAKAEDTSLPLGG